MLDTYLFYTKYLHRKDSRITFMVMRKYFYYTTLLFRDLTEKEAFVEKVDPIIKILLFNGRIFDCKRICTTIQFNYSHGK
ncbi:hypothetical protein SPACI_023450 [Sporomusa acidovorans DSM 3132]|uniref:Uncharacterized protein n=1 Tax=Sporomusa acidovorans (strain ATCC 49682 / DSM 3132 / Mol) TaxID=1123286 RepID=A0ABZ3J2M4_SPOA4|nr:hypothetical protein SPACI_08730 [Sporomusa acidovorans DSM 3132]SDE98037.1 hypothetical protein SAMN04488499_102858 [Sporomusa acidovorans]